MGVLLVILLLTNAVTTVAPLQNIRSSGYSIASYRISSQPLNRFASSPTCLFDANFLVDEVVRGGGTLANFAGEALGLVGR